MHRSKAGRAMLRRTNAPKRYLRLMAGQAVAEPQQAEESDTVGEPHDSPWPSEPGASHEKKGIHAEYIFCTVVGTVFIDTLVWW